MDNPVEDKPKPATPSSTSPLLMVALIIACAALGYSLWNGVETRQHLTTQQLDSRDRIAQLTTSLQQQEQHLKTIVDNLKSTQDMQAQQQELLTSYTTSLQKVVSKSGGNKSDLKLDEVLFLVRNARLHVVWRRDVRSAISLLELADEQLKEDGNPEWVDIRKSIANDISKLKSVTLPDIDGILSKIGALQESLVKLPLMGKEGMVFNATPTPAVEPTTTAQPAWKNALSASLESLKKVVIIRRRDIPVEPLLAPEESQLIIGRLQIWMQQAEFGLIQNDPALYRNSLLQAKKWIESHFDKAATSSVNVIAELEGLAAIDVAPELIDLTPTQVLIEKAIAGRPKLKDESV